MKHYLFGILFCLLCSTNLYAQDVHQDLQSAMSLLDESIHQLESGNGQSIASLQRSSAMIEEVIAEYQLESAGVYHALGNAYMLQDQRGQAILSYLRGEQLDPTHQEIRHSLSVARANVSTRVPTNLTNRAWDILLGWRGFLSRGFLSLVFIGLFTIGWLSLSLGVFSVRARFAYRFGLSMILLSLLPLSMYGLDWHRHKSMRAAVITQNDAFAWSGPDNSVYELVFEESISQGVEVRIVDQRDGWSHVELADGSYCWVFSEQLTVVSP